MTMDQSVNGLRLPSCYIYHTINAHEEQNAKGERVVVMYACRIEDPLPYRDQSERATFLVSSSFVSIPTSMNFASISIPEKLSKSNLMMFPQSFRGPMIRFLEWRTLVISSRIAKEPTLLFDGFIKYDLKTGQGIHTEYGKEEEERPSLCHAPTKSQRMMVM